MISLLLFSVISIVPPFNFILIYLVPPHRLNPLGQFLVVAEVSFHYCFDFVDDVPVL